MLKKFFTIFLFSSLFSLHFSLLFASEINLPRTGQTLCYDYSTTTVITVPCEGTGQNGAIQAGQPFPSPRFTVANGTVTDNLTGLIWLRNANCLDTRGGVVMIGDGTTWSKALTWSNNLASGYCGLTDGSTVGQWRLPTRPELESLLDASKFYPALPAGHPFLNFVDGGYWSSSTYARNTTYAWSLSTRSGNFVANPKTHPYFYVLPVRGGQ